MLNAIKSCRMLCHGKSLKIPKKLHNCLRRNILEALHCNLDTHSNIILGTSKSLNLKCIENCVCDLTNCWDLHNNPLFLSIQSFRYISSSFNSNCMPVVHESLDTRMQSTQLISCSACWMNEIIQLMEQK